MQYLQITKKKGIYYDAEFQPEKINLSGALALFAPTFETLEELKQDLVSNMQHSVSQVKSNRPIFGTQDEMDQWYRDNVEVGQARVSDEHFENIMVIRTELNRLEIESLTEQPRRSVKRIIQRQQHLMQPAKRQGGVTEEQIESAREYPLEELVDSRQIFKAGGKWRSNCHCPLVGHEGEKTASFYIDKQNRYKCFGCHGAGDAIAFVMQRDGVKFVPAVKSLMK